MSLLRSLTIPLAAVPDLDGLLVGDGLLCWSRRGAGLVGRGEVARFEATGPDRFIEAEAWWRALTVAAEADDRVGLPGCGLVGFGSFAFSKTSAYRSRLVVPELVVGVRDGAAWLTVQGVGDVSEADALHRLGEWLSEPAPEPVSGASLSAGSLPDNDWMAAVEAGVAKVQAGALEKLVLARDVLATGQNVTAPAILRELVTAYQECWTYSVDGLVGATPEMLIRVEGRTAQARVLAGTLDREDGEDPRTVLLGSVKQRHEHDIAIQSLTRQLGPFVEVMNAHDEPFILELPNVWHLASDVKAELAEVEGHVPSPLALINALHPTAAVCGTPTIVAGALIRELEHLDRGPYAGPVGWLDSRGNGEWGIALRGGVIESPSTIRLYAGAGIVAASNPAHELAETRAKLRPMTEALGIRG